MKGSYIVVHRFTNSGVTSEHAVKGFKTESAAERLPFDLAQWIAKCFKPSELERCDREIARIRQEPIAFTSPAYLSTMGVNDWQLERKVIAGERSELNVGGNLVRCG